MMHTIPGIIALLGLTRPAPADNWPHWRGPEGTGQCKEKGLPLKWSATENVRWKAPLPGKGFSSPVVWGDRVFLTQALDKDGHQRAVLCLDRRDGKPLWQKVTEYSGTEST